MVTKDLRRALKRDEIASFFCVFGGIAAIAAYYSIFHTFRGGKVAVLLGCLIGYLIGYPISRMIVVMPKRGG